MAISLASLKHGVEFNPPRVMVYGVEGVGKSTFGASAPAPVFICTEEGLGSIDVSRFPLATSFNDVIEAIGALYQEEHEFQTVVVDSLDWLETMIWEQIKATHEDKDLAYGKGAVIAANEFKKTLEGLNALRVDKQMNVILLAHNQIRRFDSPESDPYDRYQPKLQERSGALVREWCDCVLFANWKTHTAKTDKGFGNQHVRGIATGKRLLHTVEHPAYLAKNRYALPDTMALDWATFENAVRRTGKTQTNTDEPATRETQDA